MPRPVERERVTAGSIFDRIAELERAHAVFTVATVVARRSPVSSHLGDRALVFADGEMEGFVGGSCSRDIVRREALRAMQSGRPRLLRIRPDERPSAAAVDDGAEDIVIPMSCSSEGAVEIYLEPHLPLRRLLVAGFTPVADALARLSAQLGYDVTRVSADEEQNDLPAIEGITTLTVRELRAHLEALGPAACSRLVAVVASQGFYDEAALETLLGFSPAFVGLLASRKRAATVKAVLAQSGVTGERLATIRTPVGLDIGAKTPGEVAISVLAEIIAATPAGITAEGGVLAAPPTAADPVCGMDVEIATARHRYAYAGTTYVFCCASCAAAFASAPEQHLASTSA